MGRVQLDRHSQDREVTAEQRNSNIRGSGVEVVIEGLSHQRPVSRIIGSSVEQHGANELGVSAGRPPPITLSWDTSRSPVASRDTAAIGEGSVANVTGSNGRASRS
jgi:hypothetical protein